MLDPPDIETRFHAAQVIARDAGRLALDRFRNRHLLQVETKSPQDVVSEADREVEALIRSRLARLYPADDFLGEEGGRTAGAGESAGLWVVDPIDGTDCFVNRIPVWCVSIAFVVGREVEVGVVYDPNAEELFAAMRGRGASLNGAPIGVREARSFAEGTTGIGYSTRTEPQPALRAIEGLLAAGGMYQRNGSGALMLAYVAAGRLIGYYEAHINAWDCLAGILLVREAGGWTSDFLSGDALRRGNPVAASARGLDAAMRALTGLS